MERTEYEYEFVRLGEGWLHADSQAEQSYREVVKEYASNGWRLVQVFAPSLGARGLAKFYELIFERPRA